MQSLYYRLLIKTHDCAAQGNMACANRVSILAGTTKSWFSRIHSSVMTNPNGTKFTTEMPPTQGRPHSKFEENSFSHSQDMNNQTFIFFSFCTLCVNCYNSRMRASIWLKFGPPIGGLKAITSIKFWVNLINIQKVIQVILCIKQSWTSIMPTW